MCTNISQTVCLGKKNIPTGPLTPIAMWYAGCQTTQQHISLVMHTFRGAPLLLLLLGLGTQLLVQLTDFFEVCMSQGCKGYSMIRTACLDLGPTRRQTASADLYLNLNSTQPPQTQTR